MSIKSFDEIRGLVENVVMQKKAHDTNTPADPFEVATPAVTASGVIAEKCVNVPEGKANGTATEKQTTSLPVQSSDDKASVTPEKKDVVSVTEEEVTKQGSALLNKIQQKLAAKKEVVKEPKKEAAASNVASGIDLSVESLAKVAKEILNTEEGVQFAQELFRKRAGEEYAKEAIKEASEQARTFEQYEQVIKQASEKNMNPTDQFITKVASEIENLSPSEKQLAYASIKAHDTNLSSFGDSEILKCAYASGVEDAAAIQENPELIADAMQAPSEEEAGAADITPEEILEVVNEMVESGEIDEATAQQLLQELSGAIDEEAGAAQPSEEEVAAAEQVASPEGAVDEAEISEAAKMASVIIEGTQRLKKASVAEGVIPAEEGEATIEDVIGVIQQLEEEGSISGEEAQEILQEIASAMAEGEEGAEEVAEEDEEPSEDEVVAAEVAKSASVIGASL